MDLFGKILVLVTFGLSLLMAAIGGAVLYYRVDWTDTPATADQPAGELVARIQKLKQAEELVGPAGKDWSDARAVLSPAEDRRKLDAVWYATELEHLRTDPNNKPLQALYAKSDVPLDDWMKAQGGNPIKALDYQNGGAIPDPANFLLPKMIPVVDRYIPPAAPPPPKQPLLCRKVYDHIIAETDAKTLAKFAKLLDSSQTDTQLTIRLIGPAGLPDLIAQVEDQKKKLEEKNDDDADTKAFKKQLTKLLDDHETKLKDLLGKTTFARGLDQRIQDEKVKQQDVAEEMKLVKLAEGQVRADSQLLKIRKNQLEARKEELEKPKVTTTQP